MRGLLETAMKARRKCVQAAGTNNAVHAKRLLKGDDNVRRYRARDGTVDKKNRSIIILE